MVGKRKLEDLSRLLEKHLCRYCEDRVSKTGTLELDVKAGKQIDLFWVSTILGIVTEISLDLVSIRWNLSLTSITDLPGNSVFQPDVPQ